MDITFCSCTIFVGDAVATQFLQTCLFSIDRKDISKLSIQVNMLNCFHPFESNTLPFLSSMTRQHNKRYLLLALCDIFCKNMTNHKARKKLANQKWIHRSVYPCGISQPRLGVVSQTDYAWNFATCLAATQATNWGWVFFTVGYRWFRSQWVNSGAFCQNRTFWTIWRFLG